MDRETLATALLAGMKAMEDESDSFVFEEITVVSDGKVWIKTEGPIDLRELADYVIAAIAQ